MDDVRPAKRVLFGLDTNPAPTRPVSGRGGKRGFGGGVGAREVRATNWHNNVVPRPWRIIIYCSFYLQPTMPNRQPTPTASEAANPSPASRSTTDPSLLDEASLSMITTMATEMAIQMTAKIMENAATLQPSAAAPATRTRYSTLTWSDVPPMNTREGARLDGWFISFEAKMKAAHIPEEDWAGNWRSVRRFRSP